MRCSWSIADKRGNRDRAELAINVNGQQPPELKLEFPAKDLDVFAAGGDHRPRRVWDDFAVKRVGISYSMAGQPAKDVVIAENLTGKDRAAVSQTISMEQLAALPDQLLSYHIWAEDIWPGRQGSPHAGRHVLRRSAALRANLPPGRAADEEQQQQQAANNSSDSSSTAQGPAEPGRAAGRGSGRA